MHITQVECLPRYAPTLEYGVGFVPAPPDGEHPTGWIGGWSLAIPRGAPASAEAFTFLRWMCASPEGTLLAGRELGQFPAYRRSPYYETIRDDEMRKVFYEIVRNAKHTRTLMPAQGYLMNLLRRAVDDVLYGGADPQVVLDEVTAKAQARLEYVSRHSARGAGEAP
jgi:multiple sugar transport system substrate-binding protein